MTSASTKGAGLPCASAGALSGVSAMTPPIPGMKSSFGQRIGHGPRLLTAVAVLMTAASAATNCASTVVMDIAMLRPPSGDEVMILDMRYMTSGQMSALSEADLERARKETKEQIASDMAEYGKQRMQRAIEPLGTVDIRTSDIDALCDLFGGWTGGA